MNSDRENIKEKIQLLQINDDRNLEKHIYDPSEVCDVVDNNGDNDDDDDDDNNDNDNNDNDNKDDNIKKSIKNLHLKLLSTKTTTEIATPIKLSSSATTTTTTTTNISNTINCDYDDDDDDGKYVKKLDITFKNLTYNVKDGFWSRENKTILHGLNGHFKSGELTAIMGPSGAGKSSLLNILAGYTIYNITGDINVNGKTRDLKNFLPQSAFIMQDTDLQPFLTVAESMHFSANLKLGNILTKSQKRERIKHILEAIGMYETRYTRTGNLSGGQKKRLSIALELMSNPPVLILDEPTSGLDSSTSTQCISLLKKLAMEGRTVICTIHQPSALVFGMFDHLYSIAEGRCIYSGATENVIPFLDELNLKCPESYNPADYLLEISTNDYGDENPRLVEKIENGLCEDYRKLYQTKAQIEIMGKVDEMMESGLITPVKALHLPPTLVSQKSSTLSPIVESSLSVLGSRLVDDSTSNLKSVRIIKQIKKPSLQIDPSLLCQRENRYVASFWQQLSVLLLRTFLILWRDKSLTTTRIIIHTIMGLFVGILYYGIGNDAANIYNNFRYIFFSIMTVSYTAFSSIILNFPLEFPIVSREHFNRWYSLRAYYVALTLADVPIQLCCTGIFLGTSYILTSQPMEIMRMSLFFLVVVVTTMVGQSIGLTVGASLSVKNGAIFGPFFICPFLVFSGFFVQLKDVHASMQWLFHISFLKYALEGSSLAIFGYSRPKMECNSVFCQYVRPARFLQAIGFEHGSYEFALLALFIIFFGLRILSFYIMSFRLRLFR